MLNLIPVSMARRLQSRRPFPYMTILPDPKHPIANLWGYQHAHDESAQGLVLRPFVAKAPKEQHAPDRGLTSKQLTCSL